MVSDPVAGIVKESLIEFVGSVDVLEREISRERVSGSEIDSVLSDSEIERVRLSDSVRDKDFEGE